ncbi:DNA-binding transcriptional regulator, LysR family [Pseudoxanthomonas sp. GM95]|uniref:LysR family transcriptional regulator n=1 Tax=Pseudoxanthomonas sp. GM95 TaxID=1881043 RepID=UPI0008B61E63|nr:LysR family transcriptional regulator [Pseudoxanthomonas sp. GM95]SEM54108.1 DNA-binding transcriptional regulator, LysR family [Pseudoxanthomonas sp. GM95]
MDLKRLRYFVTVARRRSFVKAAEELHISQPPLSQRIQELEMEVGAKLIDRDSRPLSLTAAGQLLYDQAVELLQRAEAMTASMQRMLSSQRPTFTFGVVPANFHGSFATIIRLFRQALPLMTVRLLELNSLEQIDALREGRIDAGISRVDIQAEGVHRIVLRHEPMVAALPSDHPLANQEEVMSLEDIRDEPFLIYTSHPRPSLADHVLSQLSKRGVELTNTQEVDQYDSALIMIAAGCGVSIVPSSARLVAVPDVTYRPLAELITSPIVLCHRQDDRSTEIEALYFVIARFLAERGHEVPQELLRHRDELARAES